jgi:alpha-glucuronidase
VQHYDRGVTEAGEMSRTWTSIRPDVDAERWQTVSSDLRREQDEARWWRGASVAYFQSLSKLPLRRGSRPPEHPLAYYEALCPPGLPGQRR